MRLFKPMALECTVYVTSAFRTLQFFMAPVPPGKTEAAGSQKRGH
jgi:hypothetical protein